jgi:hypothetical protein
MSGKSSPAKTLTTGSLALIHNQSVRALHSVESPRVARSRRKFLRFFPGRFRDPTYLDWERSYKWNAPQRWNELLGFTEYRELLQKRKFTEIATRALKIEARTILLFSFEKMANSLCREVADWSSFVRKRPLRFPLWSGKRGEQVPTLGRCRGRASAKANPSPDLARADCVWIYCPAGNSYLSQAERDSHRRSGIRLRFPISVPPFLEVLCKLSQISRNFAP